MVQAKYDIVLGFIIPGVGYSHKKDSIHKLVYCGKNPLPNILNPLKPNKIDNNIFIANCNAKFKQNLDDNHHYSVISIPKDTILYCSINYDNLVEVEFSNRVYEYISNYTKYKFNVACPIHSDSFINKNNQLILKLNNKRLFRVFKDIFEI